MIFFLLEPFLDNEIWSSVDLNFFIQNAQFQCQYPQDVCVITYTNLEWKYNKWRLLNILSVMTTICIPKLLTIDFQFEDLIKHKFAVLIIAGGIDEFFVFANSNISKELTNSE